MPGFGPLAPVVVQPAGWYFKPIKIIKVTVAVQTSRRTNRAGCASSWGGRL